MKLKLDKQADALYLTLDESLAVESEEVSPGIIVDYRADGMVIGIEMLYLSRRSPGADLQRLLYETVELGAVPA